MNLIAITGNVATDIEVRKTQSGVSVANFRVAVRRKYRNANGQHDADFFAVVAWRQSAEFAEKYLAKGRKVCVVGQMQSRQYDAQDGSKRTVWELIADNLEGLDKATESVTGATATNEAEGFTEVDAGDDLPF